MRPELTDLAPESSAVVLSGKDHDDLWDLVIEALAKVTPTEAGRKSNEGKIAS